MFGKCSPSPPCVVQQIRAELIARDLKFSGFVTWTGNSSMEVVVKMQGARAGAAPTGSSSEEDWETLMLGRFAMVCRNAKTLKARKVPPLLVESEEEKMLWDLGEGELY